MGNKACLTPTNTVMLFATNVAHKVTLMNTMNRTKYISYYRVSTVRQGRSGLGLEAQRQAVQTHLHGVKPNSEFTEVESCSPKPWRPVAFTKPPW